MTLLDEVEERRHYAEQIQENAARLAHTHTSFNTTGQGSLEFEDRVDFGVVYMEKPIVSYGCSIDVDDLGDLQGIGAGETPILPLATGYVTNWDVDDRNFYVGCWVAVRVYFPPEDLVDIRMNVEMSHYFTFSAVALKDIPTTVTP